MKILHFADLHLGVTTNGFNVPGELNTRVQDFLDTLDTLVEFVEDNQVDLVLFAGDWFDKYGVDAVLVKETAIRLREMADIAVVVMISGNHDMRMIGASDTFVGMFSKLYIENLYTTDKPTVMEVNTTGGRAVLALMPYPRFSSYVHTKIDDADERQETFDMTVSEVLDKLTAEAMELKGDDPCFLVGHFTVTGCDFGGGRLAWGNDSYVSPQQLKSPWDYVALGHIHKHQVLVDNPPVIYSGSLDRCDFGEEHEDKGFVMIESVGPAIHWKFVPIPVRPMVTYRYDLRGEPNPQKKLISNLEHESLPEDGIVRVIVQSDYGAEFNLRAVRKALSGVYYVAQINIERDKPEREGRIEDLDFDTHDLDKVELLEIYYHGLGIDIIERDALHDLFTEIAEEVEDNA